MIELNGHLSPTHSLRSIDNDPQTACVVSPPLYLFSFTKEKYCFTKKKVQTSFPAPHTQLSQHPHQHFVLLPSLQTHTSYPLFLSLLFKIYIKFLILDEYTKKWKLFQLLQILNG